MKPYASRVGMTANAEAVREQLRAAIAATGWSETARRCGMDRTALHRAFRVHPATQCPNFATIAVVAQAVGLTVALQPVDGGHQQPAESAWCDQCDRMVSRARAAQCASKFCKLKVADQ